MSHVDQTSARFGTSILDSVVYPCSLTRSASKKSAWISYVRTLISDNAGTAPGGAPGIGLWSSSSMSTPSAAQSSLLASDISLLYSSWVLAAPFLYAKSSATIFFISSESVIGCSGSGVMIGSPGSGSWLVGSTLYFFSISAFFLSSAIASSVPFARMLPSVEGFSTGAGSSTGFSAGFETSLPGFGFGLAIGSSIL